MKTLTIMGVTFEVSDKVLYANSEIVKEYIDAIKKGKGVAKRILNK